MTQDIDDLIARLEQGAAPLDDPDLNDLAAAALREQRDEIARLTKLTEPNQIDWAARCGRAEAEIERLKDECERERIRLAACGAAALGYHKDGDSIHSDYTSASLSDVHALVAKLEKAEAERDALRAELRKWCVSSHTNKCYICDWSWSDGAPQIHSKECLCYGDIKNDN